jgi:ribonuclease P protein component
VTSSGTTSCGLFSISKRLGVLIVQKRLRLQKKKEFNLVFKHGKVAANHQFVIYHKTSKDTKQFRLGVSASKKIGNAVTRNTIRRRIKEIVRKMEHRIIFNIDIICIVRKPALELDHLELKRSIVHVLTRARLIRH